MKAVEALRRAGVVLTPAEWNELVDELRAAGALPPWYEPGRRDPAKMLVEED